MSDECCTYQPVPHHTSPSYYHNTNVCPENQNRTEGEKAFKYAGLVFWNNLQKGQKLSKMVTMQEFKFILKERENNSSTNLAPATVTVEAQDCNHNTLH